jgi:4-amino-4-deoxy-L-arabinose transferase-like glycosyltransferase
MVNNSGAGALAKGAPRSFIEALDRNRAWLVTGLIGLAFALRVVGLDFQSLWRDEVDAIRFASQPLKQLFGLLVNPGQNGPLYYFALRPWLALAGESAFALRFFSAALSTLAVPLIYRLGRRLFPSLPGLALLAAFLAATSPYLIWYGQEGKMYALVVVLVLLSMECYLAALERGGWHRWLLYVVFASTAFYVHLIAALMIPVQALVFFFTGSEIRKARWRPWLASMAALTLPYLPLIRWQLPLLQAGGSTGYAFVPLPEMLISLLTSYSLGVVQRATIGSVSLFVGLLLAAALLWKGHRSRLASLAILACWLFMPILGLFLITLVRPMYTARYLIFIAPAYLLLLAAGVVAVARLSRWLAGLWLVALLVLNGMGVWLQARTPYKADFRGATNYLASRMEPGDLLLFQIPYGRYSFDYYYQRYLAAQAEPSKAGSPSSNGGFQVFMPTVAGAGTYRWADGPYTNGGMDAGQVDRSMATLTTGSRVVWLVATEVPLWDERGLVQAWLDEHGRVTDVAEFVRVVVTRYELP